MAIIGNIYPMRISTIFAPVVGVLLVLGVVGPVSAQRPSEENEQLERPAVAPSNIGAFKDFNSLPESLRKNATLARMLHDYKLRAGADGYIDQSARAEAFEDAKAALTRETANPAKVSGSKLPVFADAWTNIGPTNSAGCTRALAIDPKNGSIAYAGAAGGGLWKTTNAGGSWTPLTDNLLPNQGVAAIGIDPKNTNTIFLGSGDAVYNSISLVGSGLYKSTDGGANWSHIAASTFTGTVNKVLVNPLNSNIVLACNYSKPGIYRSTDGGSSFTKVYPTAGNATAVIWDIVAADVINNKQVFFAVEGNTPGGSSTQAGIYRSSDDGATWSKITNGLPAGNTIGKAALGIPNNKTHVYCLISNPSGDLTGLYASTNSGAGFSKVNSTPTDVFNIGYGAQGFYDLYLGVSPGFGTTDTLYIGGIIAYRSTNSGSSWTQYVNTPNDNIHVDQQCIAIDPSNSKNLLMGCDGGVYRSTNGGASWSYRSNNMHSMRVYHLGLSKLDSKTTLAGFQDQGIWNAYKGQNPSQLWGGDGFQPMVDPSDANVIYAENQYGSIWKSNDGGQNFNYINDQSFEPYADWDAPLKMAPHNHLTVFTGRTDVWRSIDGGSSWDPISNGLGNPYILSLGLSPANSNVYWAGCDGGKIYVTTSAGGSWNDVSTGVPKVAITSIVCHPLVDDFALISVAATSKNQARVLLTTDQGADWTDVSGSGTTALPGVPVYGVALDSVNPATTWYAATDYGIYYTLNGGQSWSVAGTGLGLAACTDVQVHANKTTIRVGTYGRSIWEGNVNVLPVEMTGLTATKTSAGTSLIWKTANERGNTGFWVERSFNYQAFTDLGFVPGSGTTNDEHSYGFVDTMKTSGVYIYRLKQMDLDGSAHLSNTVEVSYGESAAFRLDQNYPNPFSLASGATRIHFELPAEATASLKIFSAEGKLIKALLDNTELTGGPHDVSWDGTDNGGNTVASGSYYYSLETATGEHLSGKMVVVSK